jgi:DNA-directed RNA polymerase subunit D
MIHVENVVEKEGGGYKMEVRLLTHEKKTGKVSFLLKDSTPAFANTVRRLLIDEVPSLAIEEVELAKNSSVLYDEIVAHRLGLIPLTTDLKTYELPQENLPLADQPAKCVVKFTLKAKGPKIVLSGDLVSNDPKVKPVHEGIPIVKLLKGQEIELHASATLGKGRTHAKWSPGLAFYKNKPTIDITKNPGNPEEVAKCCSVDVFTAKNGKLAINKDNYLACHLCGDCVEKSKGDVTVEDEGKDFVFFLEPFGQLKAKEMLTQAAQELEDKSDVFVDAVQKLEA